MIRSVPAVAVVVALVVAAPPAAHAVWFFDFDWRTFAEFVTLFPDEVRISGSRTGHGVLALNRPPELDGGFFFEFSGTGGSGSGQTLADGTTIVAGEVNPPLPPHVPVRTSPASGFSGGTLNFVGSPSNPSAISISYFEGLEPALPEPLLRDRVRRGGDAAGGDGAGAVRDVDRGARSRRRGGGPCARPPRPRALAARALIDLERAATVVPARWRT